MLGFMNQEAWHKTQQTQFVHFWSRSRKQLWKKGETSGNELQVKDVFLDCDQDTVLVKAQACGPTCHTGSRACFFSRVAPTSDIDASSQEITAWGGIMQRLYEMVSHRKGSS